jgi:probable rRNA maturation factor
VPSHISEISLLITNDLEIKNLNSEYRNKDKATDVLSFPQISNTESLIDSSSLGDIVISIDTAKKQALRYKCSLKKELTRLLVHGILHLLGYDHENVSKSEAQRMRRKEKKILSMLN